MRDLWKTNECGFPKLYDKSCNYLLIAYMTKLFNTESQTCVTCKIIHSHNCQYFHNEKTFVMQGQVVQKAIILIQD